MIMMSIKLFINCEFHFSLAKGSVYKAGLLIYIVKMYLILEIFFSTTCTIVKGDKKNALIWCPWQFLHKL